VRFDARRVQRDIRHLAVDIGPREATSRNFAEAADWVERRLERLGYRVRRTRVSVPAGNSWGTPVRRGTSVNVIAEPRGFDRRSAHVVIGAHLDTVPVAPGAEDNASGVAVMLELARLAAAEPTERPVQFIAFGAEEPRGSGDALHHFGSQQLVADLSRAERRAVSAMVSLDRVGVRAGYVPVCRGGPVGADLQATLRRVGRREDITTRGCENQTSDHWSYEKAGMPAARIGSVPYAGYHSRGDVPSVVSRGQLARVGRLMWAWLS
jgi:Iap family predicted aminopeptidase